MSDYKSVNQSVKDIINGVLVASVLDNQKSYGRIITLDDKKNGTTKMFLKNGYGGRVTVVQRDRDVMSTQFDQFYRDFPEMESGKFSVHQGDILEHFGTSVNVWKERSLVDLWNFDFMGTFFVETSMMIKRFLEDPSLSIRPDENGTVVAFTFQAIAHGLLLTRFKNNEDWQDHLKLYGEMKSWSFEQIADYYLKEIDNLVTEYKPECLNWEPVLLESKPGYEKHITRNSIVYGGVKSNESTMMFVLYRVRHLANCGFSHQFTPSSNKRTVGDVQTEEMLTMEKEVLDELAVEEESAIEDVMMEEANCSICKDIRHFTHQTEAIKATMENTKGIISMVCGSGKSYVIKHVVGLHRFAAVYAPTKNLVQQIAERYFENDGDFICFKINSDNNYKASTIRKRIEKSSQNKTIVFVVNYQSYQHFTELCRELEISMDVNLYDEAHHTSSKKKRNMLKDNVEDNSDEEDVEAESDDEESEDEKKVEDGGDETEDIDYSEDEELLQAEDHLIEEENDDVFAKNDRVERLDLDTKDVSKGKSFFFTATPSPIMRKTPEIYGDIIYNYTFKQAVEDGIVKNFDTVIGLYREEGQSITSTGVNYERLIREINTVIMERECKRILIYTRTVVKNSSDPSVDEMEKHQEKFGSFQTYFIRAGTKKAQREQIMERFCKDDDDVHIIVSCKTISEGIDLVNCDMVVMLDLTKSEVLTIQRAMRGCRLKSVERSSGTWKNAVVYFPLNISRTEFFSFVDTEDKKKFLNDNVRRSQYEHPMRILNTIKNDLNMDVVWSIDTRKTDYFLSGYRVDIKKRKRDIEENGTCEVEIIIPPFDIEWKFDTNDFERKLSNLVISFDILDWDERWMKKAIMYRDWVDHNGKHPSLSGEETVEKKLWSWGHIQRAVKRGKRHGRLSQEKIDFLGSIPGWRWDMDQNWMLQAITYRDWVISHEEKHPSSTSKDPVEKLLGIWACNQRKRKKEGHFVQDRSNFLDGIPGWKWNQEENWMEQALVYRDWVLIHDGKHPISTSKDIVEKQLGNWASNQRKGKREGKLVQDRSSFLDKIPGWKWKTDQDEIWMEQAIAYNDWVISHNEEHPSHHSNDLHEKQLGNWACTQRAIRKGIRKGNLTQEKIDFISNIIGWKWNTDLEDIWEKHGIAYRDWVIAHSGKHPSQHGKVPVEKQLANWASRQRALRKGKGKGYLSEDKINFLNNISGWNWEPALEENWNQQRTAYCDWVTHHGGKHPSPTSKDSLEKQLATWRYAQRAKRNEKVRGRLSQEKIISLEKIPGWKWKIDLDENWIQQEIEYREWVIKNCGKHPTRHSNDIHEKQLGNWACTQRAVRKGKRKGNLSQTKIDLLKTIPGWTWGDEK